MNRTDQASFAIDRSLGQVAEKMSAAPADRKELSFEVTDGVGSCAHHFAWREVFRWPDLDVDV